MKLWVSPPSTKRMAHYPWTIPLILRVSYLGTLERVTITPFTGAHLLNSLWGWGFTSGFSPLGVGGILGGWSSWNGSFFKLVGSLSSTWPPCSSSSLSVATSLSWICPLTMHLWWGTHGYLKVKHSFLLIKSHLVASSNFSLPFQSLNWFPILVLLWHNGFGKNFSLRRWVC